MAWHEKRYRLRNKCERRCAKREKNGNVFMSDNLPNWQMHRRGG
jgi:hypothetical protein